MERFIVNATGGKVRRVTRNGREYFVAPMTLIVPGVLPGSQGPLYYSPDETAKAAPDWNDIPIVVYHPVHNGKPVPGRDVNVLTRSKIGRVYNSRFSDRLKAEGWFNVADTKRVDPRVHDALEANQPVELSTGLYTTNVPAPPGSEHNGRAFTHYATRHRPEHLAVLPDVRGACSNDDGCGVLVNQRGQPMPLKDFSNSLLRGLALLGGGSSTPAGPVGPLLQPTGPAGPVLPAAGDPDEPTVNEPSHSDVSMALHAQLAERFLKGRSAGDGPRSIEDSLFVLEVYDKEVVYVRGEKTWRLGYTKDNKANTVTLSDDEPEEVVKVTQYKKVDNQSGVGDPNNPGDPSMCPKLSDTQRRQYAEGVANNLSLTANHADRNKAVEDYLKMSDENLVLMHERTRGLTHNQDKGIPQPDGSMHYFNDKLGRWEIHYPPVVNAAPPPPPTPPSVSPPASPPTPPVANTGANPPAIPVATPVTTPKPQNQGEWLALMPPDAQAIWNSAVAVHDEKKTELIGRLTANMAEPYKQQAVDIYKGMGLPQLQALAAALPPANEHHQYTAPAPAQNIFTGASGAPAPAPTINEEPLLQPTYQWGPNK